MCELGWLPSPTSAVEMLSELLSYFGTASFEALDQVDMQRAKMIPASHLNGLKARLEFQASEPGPFAGSDMRKTRSHSQNRAVARIISHRTEQLVFDSGLKGAAKRPRLTETDCPLPDSLAVE